MTLDLAQVDAFAARAHESQRRHTGENPEPPYIVHPRAVRDVLLSHPDPSAREPWILATALLHDVLEDCEVHHEELSTRFGADVSAAVRALSKQMRMVAGATKDNAQYWQVLAQSPLAIRRVKAADRIDNLRACVARPSSRKSAEYLIETPAVVMPLVAEDPYLHGLLAELVAELHRRCH